MIFDSEQFTSDKTGESNKTVGEGTKGDCEFDQEGHTTSILISSQARHYSTADMQRLRFETRWCEGEVESVSSKRGDIRDGRTFEELWTTTSTVLIPRGLESGMCALCIGTMPDGWL